MKRNNRKVTQHVAQHSDADSLTHEKDKARFTELHSQKVKENELVDDIKKTAELILHRSGLETAYGYQQAPNQYLILENNTLSPAAGRDYAKFIEDESEKRRRYRAYPDGKPNKIAKNSGVNILTYTLLPAHSTFLRTLSKEAQLKFILDLARRRAAQIETLTGWRVLGIALHNDTAIIHFDFMATRYSEPVSPLLGTRQRMPACELLGDRRGIRSVGPCVCGFFRLAAEKQFDCIRPGLEKDAIYKLGAHRHEYDGEYPVDHQVVLAIDEDIRTTFGAAPEFQAICNEWYAWQAQIVRERSVKPLRNLVEQDKMAEKLPAAVSVLNTLLGAYEERGLRGASDAVDKIKLDFSSASRSQAESLLAEKSALLAAVEVVKTENLRLNDASVVSQQQMSELAEKNGASEQQIKDLTGRCAQLVQENGDAGVVNFGLRQDLGSAQQENLITRQSLIVKIKENLALDGRLTMVTKEKQVLVGEKAVLGAKLNSALSENNVLKLKVHIGEREVASLESWFGSHQQQTKGLDDRCNELEQRLAEAEQAKASIEAEYSLVNMRNAELVAQVRGGDKKIAELVNKNTQLEQGAAAAIKNAAGLRGELDSAEKTIEEMQGQIKSLEAKTTDVVSKYFLVDLLTNELAFAGTWEDITKYYKSHGATSSRLLPVKQDERDPQLMYDPDQRQKLADDELGRRVIDPFMSGLLQARFPAVNNIDEVLNQYKAGAFQVLRRQELQAGRAPRPVAGMAR